MWLGLEISESDVEELVQDFDLIISYSVYTHCTVNFQSQKYYTKYNTTFIVHHHNVDNCSIREYLRILLYAKTMEDNSSKEGRHDKLVNYTAIKIRKP